MTFEEAKKYVVYSTIAGSKAYDLDLPTSDTDIRGIYLLPNEYLLGKGYKDQVSDRTNDTVYYDLNRFVNLLEKNNPNIIENLFTDKSKILTYNDIIDPLYLNRHKFLTKQIRFTFGGYAISQIKKARGLNKKIVNPVPKTKKTPLDFCYIFDTVGYMMKARQWLRKNEIKQECIGLSEMPNGVQLYKVFYDWNGRFRGITSRGSDEVRHSEIPKGWNPEAFLFYNKDGYSSYCKDYKEYWEWVNKRNPVRYQDNVSHNQGYDGKNMMHCLRMLDMAIEIAETGNVTLIRPNRDWLLSVRRGAVSYDEIMGLIEEKREKMDSAFDKSDLPDKVEEGLAHDILMEIRK